MSEQIYNWKRFWCPRTGRIYLSDDGYLTDPDSEWGRTINPDVAPFESIAKFQCLVLLGEPGIGKTYAIKTEYKAIDEKVKKEGNQTYSLDLRPYSNEERLVKALFEKPTFISWLEGKYNLHIFLDSFDECLLRIDTLSAILSEELKQYPVERLFLRIACRTADWPSGLEKELIQLYGEESVGIYELVPLRKIDVIEAVRTRNIDHDTFLEEVKRKEAVPLAIKPITLDFLLNVYQKKGKLFSTQVALYLEGCRVLCEEPNVGRRGARLTGTLTAEQRMTVASRLAAITIFSNRYAIWTDIDRGNVPEEDVTINSLCNGKEIMDGGQLNITKSAIKETVSTGLFSARGPNRMSWSHKTYAEFLAARYLVQNKMTIKQMMSLIIHSSDPDKKLVPQLHETAAWLADMAPDVFDEIMKTDPEVLLRSDVATLDEKKQTDLVETLLRLYEEEKLLSRASEYYHKLMHPQLLKQIKPYICDSGKGIIVRSVAIDIAEACKLKQLQDDLVNISLNQSQQIEIRVEATKAVCRIGDEKTKKRLMPLAKGEIGDDPDDELKGCSLNAVWPAYMTTQEVFSVLTPPKNSDLLGRYYYFLSDNLSNNLRPSDLPTALECVSMQGARHNLPYVIRKLI